MELEQAIFGRRSVRVFSEREVEQEKIEKMITAATWAPSACNQQLWDFIIIRKNETKRRLCTEAACNTLVMKAPVVVAVTYIKENLKPEYVSQSAAAAIQNMLLSAYSLGLGSCWLSGIGSEKKIKEILKIPDNRFVVAFVMVGYPKATAGLWGRKEGAEKHGPAEPNLPKAMPPKRKPVLEVIHNEHYAKKGIKYLTGHDPESWTYENIREYSDMTSRKTEPGSVMDIANAEEKRLVKDVLSAYSKKSVLDLFPYDGSFLQYFPECKLSAVELTEGTAVYAQKAAEKKIRFYWPETSEDIKKIKEKFDVITAVFKLERFPNGEKAKIIDAASALLKKNGSLIIFLRTKNSFYGILYWVLKLFSGNDIKSSALYSFFGPYKPMKRSEARNILKRSGLVVERITGHFLIPPAVDDVFQLMLQYFRSEKTNFVHRLESRNIFARVLRKMIEIQGRGRMPLGSACVIIAKKKE